MTNYSRLSEINKIFADNDIDGLKTIGSELVKEGMRSYQLLGDLHRRKKDFKQASLAYLESDRLAPKHNAAALYGLLECYKELDQGEKFSETLHPFIETSSYNENTFSRLILAAAILEETDSVEVLAKALDEHIAESTDARVWFRFGKALLLNGIPDRAKICGKKAEELAGDNIDLSLEVSTLNYRIEEYWDLRYSSSQGERTPLKEDEQSDEAYAAVTKRDVEYLDSVFDEVFPDTSFDKSADCGCGSGRLTFYLAAKTKSLECYDISPRAVEFAKENNKHLQNVSFQASNLADNSLPKERYDLLFDFTAVQHVADPVQWKNVLENYANSCLDGGHIFLFEAIGNDKNKDILHLTNASPATYIKTMNDFGMKLIFQKKSSWGHIGMVFQKNSWSHKRQ